MPSNDDGRRFTEPVSWMDPVLWSEDPPLPMTDEQKQEMLRIIYENQTREPHGGQH